MQVNRVRSDLSSCKQTEHYKYELSNKNIERGNRFSMFAVFTAAVNRINYGFSPDQEHTLRRSAGARRVA